MPILILILIFGFFIGRIFSSNKIISKVKNIIMPIVYVLLFFMGILVGTNETLLNNFMSLGIKAVLISLSSIAGTIVLALLSGRLIEYLIETKKR